MVLENLQILRWLLIRVQLVAIQEVSYEASLAHALVTDDQDADLPLSFDLAKHASDQRQVNAYGASVPQAMRLEWLLPRRRLAVPPVRRQGAPMTAN